MTRFLIILFKRFFESSIKGNRFEANELWWPVWVRVPQGALRLIRYWQINYVSVRVVTSCAFRVGLLKRPWRPGNFRLLHVKRMQVATPRKYLQYCRITDTIRLRVEICMPVFPKPPFWGGPWPPSGPDLLSLCPPLPIVVAVAEKKKLICFQAVDLYIRIY